VVFLVALVLCAGPWASPPIALGVGIVLALAGLTAFEARSKRVSRFLIQACVVLLGLRMDLGTLGREAVQGFVFAAATVVGVFALGLVLGRLLKTGREITLLLSSGTAICGGSAIAAVGATIGASSAAMAVTTGAVFILNAVALVAFPAIGGWLGLNDVQFGTWAGVAIHDVSSVVGAAQHYHAGDPSSSAALDTANVVKLTRVVWILPCALFAGWMTRRAMAKEAESGEVAQKSAPIVPWFIVLFVVASAVRTFVPGIEEWSGEVRLVAGTGFQAALFLIGAGLSWATLKKVGWRVLLQAVVMWVAISTAALAVVMRM
jgi:uncharacterized integral membrane protein (TIGR00698 family)